MIDRTPKPLAVRDQVRILPYGKAVWRVASIWPDVVNLVNEKTGAQRHVCRAEVYWSLVRVTGVPFPAPVRPKNNGNPKPLTLNDKVHLGTGTHVWTVSEMDDLEVTFRTRHSAKYLTWAKVFATVRRINGVPIAEVVSV